VIGKKLDPDLPRRKRDDPLHDVLELADISRPGIGLQRFKETTVERRRCDDPIAVFRLQEMHEEEDNIPAALAERRDVDVDDVQPVIEVLPESVLGNRLLKVLVRRGDKADVDSTGCLTADGEHFLLLNGPEDLYLDRGKGVSDLIEKEGAAVRDLQQAHLVRTAPVNDPLT